MGSMPIKVGDMLMKLLVDRPYFIMHNTNNLHDYKIYVECASAIYVAVCKIKHYDQVRIHIYLLYDNPEYESHDMYDRPEIPNIGWISQQMKIFGFDPKTLRIYPVHKQPYGKNHPPNTNFIHHQGNVLFAGMTKGGKKIRANLAELINYYNEHAIKNV